MSKTMDGVKQAKKLATREARHMRSTAEKEESETARFRGRKKHLQRRKCAAASETKLAVAKLGYEPPGHVFFVPVAVAWELQGAGDLVTPKLSNDWVIAKRQVPCQDVDDLRTGNRQWVGVGRPQEAAVR